MLCKGMPQDRLKWGECFCALLKVSRIRSASSCNLLRCIRVLSCRHEQLVFELFTLFMNSAMHDRLYGREEKQKIKILIVNI